MKKFLFFSLFAGWIAMVTAMFSCNRRPNPQHAFEVAKESMYLLSENPAGLNVIGFSGLDSVYGKCFMTLTERCFLSSKFQEMGQRLYGQGTDVEISDRDLERFMALSMLVDPSDMDEEPPKGDFTGWKMKVEYEQEEDGVTYHGERWFILDRTGDHILHSIEIPI